MGTGGFGMVDKIKKSMHDRVDSRASRLHKQIEAGKIGGEEGRLWLEQFCEGEGLDICCGDFLIGLSIGVDRDPKKIGAAWVGPGDTLYRFKDSSQDYIVTNYFDAFPDPLKALHEWSRVLRSGGVLALVCANAEKYSKKLGPLENLHRLNTYTSLTLPMYLKRAGFKKVRIEEEGATLRCSAKKPEPK